MRPGILGPSICLGLYETDRDFALWTAVDEDAADQIASYVQSVACVEGTVQAFQEMRTESVEQPGQQGFLSVQAVLGLIPHDGTRPIHHLGSDLFPAMRG